MKHPTSLALYDYWIRRRVHGGVSAGAIRAAELAPFVDSLFLMERAPRAGLRFRFCGAGLARRYGRDLAGTPFLDLWSAGERPVLASHLDLLAKRHTGLVTGAVAETAAGGFTAFELLLLPLNGETGFTGAIGSMVRTGGHDEANRIRARIVSLSVRSLRILPLASPQPAEERPTIYSPSGPAPIRRTYGHLIVLPGGLARENDRPVTVR